MLTGTGRAAECWLLFEGEEFKRQPWHSKPIWGHTKPMSCWRCPLVAQCLSWCAAPGCLCGSQEKAHACIPALIHGIGTLTEQTCRVPGFHLLICYAVQSDYLTAPTSLKWNQHSVDQYCRSNCLLHWTVLKVIRSMIPKTFAETRQSVV